MAGRYAERELRAVDFTVMRAHDKYVDTNHKTIMRMVESGDDLGVSRLLHTLIMILREIG
jgi:hypothetical protein